MDERRESFLDWLCLPVEVREPKSQAKYAEMIGVTEETLRRWKKDPEFAERYRQHVASAFGPDTTKLVIEQLIQDATDMDLKPSERLKFKELYLKAAGFLRSQQEEERPVQTINVTQLSDAALRELIGQKAQGALEARAQPIEATYE